MLLQVRIHPRTLHFKEPAGTSRGVYLTHDIWLLTVQDMQTGKVGMGECAPLHDLSCDASPDYATKLSYFCGILESTGEIPYQQMRDYPSMLFGMETAMLSLKNGLNPLFDTPFARGEEGIPINGLVWMGTYQQMRQRMRQKLQAGFRCVKLKIGAIDFDKELALLAQLRQDFSPEQVQLRVDANGAFSPSNALDKLAQLSEYHIHSIEQPIRQGQLHELARLCKASPLPIALDEELIGVNSLDAKRRLLDQVMPQYIVLKPSLHGGIVGCTEWIQLARERGIGSWITSALESNIGLNAIAQFAASVYGPDIQMPQGLGTGQLYTDNLSMPLHIYGDKLWIEKPIAHTSGSTGAPKEIHLDPNKMEASARATCDFLGLQPGDTALLCMSTDYIAGKMMTARARVRGLLLTEVEPSGHPLAEVGDDGFDLAAMVPLQVYNTLSVPEEAARMRKIKHLLIGGGPIDSKLEAQLRDLPNAIWATYGMTETLSHIALRRINGTESTTDPGDGEWYTPLSGIKAWVDDEGCLAIDAPTVCNDVLHTQDIAEMHADGHRFKILGRKGNVILSGGLKLQIEEIERLLASHADFEFMVTKRKDQKFGEAAVLLYVGVSREHAVEAAEHLPKHMRPRYYLEVDVIPRTPTGKPSRYIAETYDSRLESLLS